MKIKHALFAGLLCVSPIASSFVYAKAFNSQLEIGGGFLAGEDAAGDSTRFLGMGLTYEWTAIQGILFTNDSLITDAGVFYYRLYNFEAINDQYDVLPVRGVLKYTIGWTDRLRTSVYGGLLKNNVVATGATYGMDTTTLNDAQHHLTALLPAFGATINYRIAGLFGAELNVGTDLIGTGLTVSF